MQYVQDNSRLLQQMPDQSNHQTSKTQSWSFSTKGGRAHARKSCVLTSLGLTKLAMSKRRLELSFVLLLQYDQPLQSQTNEPTPSATCWGPIDLPNSRGQKMSSWIMDTNPWRKPCPWSGFRILRYGSSEMAEAIELRENYVQDIHEAAAAANWSSYP